MWAPSWHLHPLSAYGINVSYACCIFCVVIFQRRKIIWSPVKGNLCCIFRVLWISCCMRVVLTCCMHVVFFVLYFPVVWNCPCLFVFTLMWLGNFSCLCCVRVLCVLYVCCLKKNRKNVLYCCVVFFACDIFVLYFCVCGTRSSILYYIFPRVERDLVFCVIYFRVWNALWYFVLYFSACGTRSDFLYYIFLRVERALFIIIIFFCVSKALLYLVLYIFRVWNTL